MFIKSWFGIEIGQYGVFKYSSVDTKMEQELPTHPEHLSSHLVFNGIHVTQSLVLWIPDHWSSLRTLYCLALDLLLIYCWLKLFLLNVLCTFMLQNNFYQSGSVLPVYTRIKENIYTSMTISIGKNSKGNMCYLYTKVACLYNYL